MVKITSPQKKRRERNMQLRLRLFLLGVVTFAVVSLWFLSGYMATIMGEVHHKHGLKPDFVRSGKKRHSRSFLGQMGHLIGFYHDDVLFEDESGEPQTKAYERKDFRVVRHMPDHELRTPPPGHNPEQVQREIEEAVATIPACRDKEPYLKIMLTTGDIRRWSTRELCNRAPTQTSINQRYGEKPVVIGMETCQAYRELLKPEHNGGQAIDPMPRVAGLYHTGTAALARTFEDNLRPIPRTSFVSPYEAPWGTHVPSQHRLNNTFPPSSREDHALVLPVVVIRDPFFWMQSMCKENFDAWWFSGEDMRCPNLVKFPHNMKTYDVVVSSHQTDHRTMENYTSLADMWSDWYLGYYHADYPRLMVRFEDTLYRPEAVLEKVRECIGEHSTVPFKYETNPADRQGRPTNFIGALQKYATDRGRHRGLDKADRKYAQVALDEELMRVFGYKQVPLEVDPYDLTGPFTGWWHTKSLEYDNILVEFSHQPPHPRAQSLA